MILSSSQLQWLCIRGTAKYVWWAKSVRDLVYDIVYWAENLEIAEESLCRLPLNFSLWPAKW